jgi:hypothetical protein
VVRGTPIPPPKRVLDDTFAQQIAFATDISNYLGPGHLNFLRDYVKNLVERVPDPRLTADNLVKELSQSRDIRAVGTEDTISLASVAEFQNALLHSKKLRELIPEKYQGVALGDITLQDIRTFWLDTGRAKLDGNTLLKTDKFNAPLANLAYEDTRQIADQSDTPDIPAGLEGPEGEDLPPFNPTIRERAIEEARSLGQTTPKERRALEIAIEIIDEVLPGEGKFIIEEEPSFEGDLLGPSSKKRGRRGKKKRTVVKLEDFKRKSILPSKESSVPKVAKAAKRGVNWGLITKYALNARLMNPLMTLFEALMSAGTLNEGENRFLQRMYDEIDNASPEKRQETFKAIMGLTDKDADLFALKAPEHIRRSAQTALEESEDAPNLEDFTPVNKLPTVKEQPVTPFDEPRPPKAERIAKVFEESAKRKAKNKAEGVEPPYTPPGSPNEPISFQELSKMRKYKPPTKDYK